MQITRYSVGLVAALSFALPLIASASVYGNVTGPSVSYGGISSGMSSAASLYYGGSTRYYGGNSMGGIGSMVGGTSAMSGMYGGMYYRQPNQLYSCNGSYSYSRCYQYWTQQDPYYYQPASYYYQPVSYYYPYQSYDYSYDYYPYQYAYDYSYYGW